MKGNQTMIIRAIQAADAEAVLDMMRAFYASPAVASDGSEEIFQNNVSNCVQECPYLEGYVFCEGASLAGYALVAHSYATEFGKPCVWIEELYVRPAFRAGGIGKGFLAHMAQKYPEAVFRLEVEAENHGAMRLYQKDGFTVLPYVELRK